MSAETPSPWWATPDDPGHLDGEDPLAAHRAARRGARADEPCGDDRSSDDPPGHDPDVCGVCPWCAGLRMLSASHPEVVAHLTDAARHLTHAVRALVADLQGSSPSDVDSDEAPVEHIDLD